MEQVRFIRDGGVTRRYHGWPVLVQQSVAEHSFHVAMLCYVLIGQREPGVRVPLLMAALCSDLAEFKVGDIPSPAKRSMDALLPDFRAKWNAMEEDLLRTVGLDWRDQLTEEEQRILSLADAFDGALYCIRERQMGNQVMEPCFKTYRKYIEDLHSIEQDIEVELIEYIDDAWELAHGKG